MGYGDIGARQVAPPQPLDQVGLHFIRSHCSMRITTALFLIQDYKKGLGEKLLFTAESWSELHASHVCFTV